MKAQAVDVPSREERLRALEERVLGIAEELHQLLEEEAHRKDESEE